MKHTHKKVFTLIVSALLVWVSIADAEFIVKTVYFQPTDAPNPTRQILDLLNETQDFYRNEMERHGYGAKTFTLETDGAGNVGFHHIRGKHNTAHYLTDTYTRVNSELPFHLTRTADAQDNVLVTIVAGTGALDDGRLGYGGYFTGNKVGGIAMVAGKSLFFGLLAHEIGHAFGLQHAVNPQAIMNNGSDILLDYEARWLNRHHFFNKKRIRNSLPRFVKSHPITAMPDSGLRFKIVAESQNGLYHAQLTRRRGKFVIGTSEIEGKAATFEVDVHRVQLIDGDAVDIQLMDVHGNRTREILNNITLPDPIPEPEPEVIAEEKIPDPEVVAVDCPDCDPPADELAVNPRFLLTTQWAALKQR